MTEDDGRTIMISNSLSRNSKNRQNQPIIFLMGPTAAGKTDLAIDWVQNRNLPAEIISVDSAMVYRGMDIGTGKPSPAQVKIVDHHLINIRDPRESYSAAEFRQDALSCIEEIRKRNRIPLLVGGTFLYFRALAQGLSPLPSAHPDIRAKLLAEGEQLGWAHLHQRLKNIDPQAADRIHPNDPQRLQRALEVYEITGRPISSFWRNDTLQSVQGAIQMIAIVPKDRAVLHQRIEQRFHNMLKRGLVAEVEQLYRRGDLHLNLPSMRAVGYRQVWEYLAGAYSYPDMINRAIAATRQLAKRQLTWLRSLSNLTILDLDDLDLELENTHSDPLKSVIHSGF